jgi:hypothetical protein
MTCSTNSSLVEHVARAICKARGFDPDGPTCDIYVEGDPVAGIPWAGYRREAKSAIRATLEWLRENPSKAVINAGVNHRLSTTLSGSNTWPDDTAALFRAMLSTALKEMEG